MTFSSLQSLSKLRSNNDEDNDNKEEDAAFASASKNNNDHKIVAFMLVGVIVRAADKGGTRSCGHLPTSTPLRRRRGGDPLLTKLQSNDNDKDNDASIASASKNDKDHVRSLLAGLRTMVESPA